MKLKTVSLLVVTSIVTVRLRASTGTNKPHKTPIFISVNLVANRNRQLSAVTHTPSTTTEKDPGVPGSFGSVWLAVQEHKWRITQLVCTASWALTQSYLLYVQKKLQNSSCWSLWQSHKTLEQLYSVPKESFVQNLNQEIADRYGTSQQGVVSYLRELELEESRLTRYGAITLWLTRLWVSPIILV